jgi:hypothetical protein
MSCNSCFIFFQFDLNDNHTNALISWVGFTPEVIALTKTTRYSSLSSTPRSNLYVSYNYGKNFVNVVTSGKSCLCVNSGSTIVNASVDNLYHALPTHNTISSSVSPLTVIFRLPSSHHCRFQLVIATVLFF